MNVQKKRNLPQKNFKLGITIAGAIAGTGILYVLLKVIFGVDALALLNDLYHVKYRPPLVAGMGLSIVFLYGFLTSFHCIGMCGGLIISQTAANPDYEDEEAEPECWWGRSISYNLGRLITNVIIGALAGGIGQIISFSGYWKGLIPFISGTMMLILGIDIIVGIPFVKRIRNLMRIRTPKSFNGKHFGKISGGPFYAGLLTGLMPCGPLQVAQAYALGTGSVLGGVISMLVFSIGTIPILFTFGVLSSFINNRFTTTILKVSAVLVITLSIVMLTKGLALGGMINSGLSPAGNIVTQYQSGCCSQ